MSSNLKYDFSILDDLPQLRKYAQAEDMILTTSKKNLTNVSNFLKTHFDDSSYPYIFQFIIHASNIRPTQWNILAHLWNSIGKPQIRFDFTLFTAYLSSKGFLDPALIAREQINEKFVQDTRTLLNKSKSEVETILINDDVKKLEAIKNPEFQENMTLISFAAYHGAYNCFMYLEKAGNEVNEETLKNIVRGGNQKLVELYEADIIKKAKELLPLSIIYHRHQITKFILSKVKLDCPLFTCVNAFNTLAFAYMVKGGAFVNEKNTVYPHTSILEHLINKKFFDHANLILQYSAKNMANATSILEKAIENNSEEVVTFFITNSKNFNCDKLVNLAARYGHLEMVKLFIEVGNAKITNEVMMSAVSSGSLQLSSYVAKQFPDYDKNQAIKTAIKFGRSNLIVRIINKIKKSGLDLKIDEFLIEAVKAEQNEIVEQLLDMGANPNSVDQSGDSALTIAIQKSNKKLVQILYLKGADVNMTVKQNKVSPLILASKVGNMKIVQFLCRRGGKINYCDETGATPLMEAAENNKVDIIRVMTHWKVNINFANPNNGVTALMIASSKGNTETVLFLLQNGALINSASMDGKTALFYACMGNFVQTAGALLDNGANIEAVDKNGLTPLWYARIHSSFEALQLLIDKGANIEHRAPDGRNILMQIEKDERSADTITKYLIGKGVDVNAVDKYGNSPLIIAARNHKTFIVRYLVDAGANTDFQDRKGFTALMIAAYDGELGIARYLLRKKCSLNLKSSRGMTALDYAKVRGYDDIADVIQTAIDKQK